MLKLLDIRRGRVQLRSMTNFFEKSGWRYKKLTTTGWELQVECGRMTLPHRYLKDLKKNNNLDVDWYAVENQIVNGTTVDCWAHKTLKRP